jgi:DNA polymerase-3 subunit alpha
VGGIIAETKRIRTKRGDPMMFATLDDLDGQVEMLVFGDALAKAEAALQPDKIVLVRGRVDHKDATKTCLIVQEAEEFDPDPEELAAAQARAAAPPPQPLHLRLNARRVPAGILEDLKHLLETSPGEAEVVLEMHTATGPRRLRLGPGYRVTPTRALLADIHHLLGDAALAA